MASRQAGSRRARATASENLVRLIPISRGAALSEFLLEIIQGFLGFVGSGLFRFNFRLFVAGLGAEFFLGIRAKLTHLLDLEQVEFVLDEMLLVFGAG